MPTSLIPKEIHKKRKGLSFSFSKIRSNVFLTAASFVLLVVGGVYGFFLFYENNLEQQTQTLNQERVQILSQSDTSARLLVTNFALRATEIQNLLAGRRTPSLIFRFLEDSTHPDVRLSRLSLSFDFGKLEIQGVTTNYRKLAEQILIWNEHPNVQDVSVSQFDTETSGLLRFSAVITLFPEAYVKP